MILTDERLLKGDKTMEFEETIFGQLYLLCCTMGMNFISVDFIDV